MPATDVRDKGVFGVFDMLLDELLVGVLGGRDQFERDSDVLNPRRLVRDGDVATNDTFDVGQYLRHVRLDTSGDPPVIVITDQLGRAAPRTPQIVNAG